MSIPSNAHLARTAVQQSGGFSLTVSDEEILAGQRTLATTTGVFAEPAAAAAVAALAKLRANSLVKPREQIVVLITGHGLKDVDAAMKNIPMPPAIAPTEAGLESIAERLAAEGASR